MGKQIPIGMPARAVRRISAAVIVFLIGTYLVDMLGPEMPRWAEIATGATKIMALLGAIWLFLRGIDQGAAADARANAYVLAHQLVISGLFLAFLYLAMGRALGFWRPNISQIEEFITVFALLSMALPTMIWAFRTSPAKGF